jgi:hypothetical protein
MILARSSKGSGGLAQLSILPKSFHSDHTLAQQFVWILFEGAVLRSNNLGDLPRRTAGHDRWRSKPSTQGCGRDVEGYCLCLVVVIGGASATAMKEEP